LFDDLHRIAGSARVALDRAHTLVAEVETRYPGIWLALDALRAHPPTPWPEWCLLPMVGPASLPARLTVLSPTEVAPSYLLDPSMIVKVSALYAWRYSRSVYMVAPRLMHRLLTQVPDPVTLDRLASLPDWCVYVSCDHPEWPGAGLWMFLEYDVLRERPELRMLIDLAEGGLDGVLGLPAVLLDRPMTEALAEVMDVLRGALGDELGAYVAALADRIDAYMGIGAYLAAPE